MKAVVELIGFHRQGRERIDGLLTRFDIVHHGANADGELRINAHGLAWILLGACQCNDQQLMQISVRGAPHQTHTLELKLSDTMAGLATWLGR